jgi:segregation and condensation protein A
MMTSAEYTVRLDSFEGPLDLLLFLIRRAEVEVTDIPISTITDQYLKHIEHLATDEAGHGIDIELAGEFLVMAATLMEIKSRMLTPVTPMPAGEGEEGETSRRRNAIEDPRAELVKQLLEYKRFRDATDALERTKRDWEGKYGTARTLQPKREKAVDPDADPDAKVDLDDVGLMDLVEAFSRILETVDLSRVGEHRVIMDDTPVEIHAEDIVDRLTRLRDEMAAAGGGKAAPEIEFSTLFTGKSRSEAIGMFLAVLELVKQQRIGVRQDEAAGRIVLALRSSDIVAEQGAEPGA